MFFFLKPSILPSSCTELFHREQWEFLQPSQHRRGKCVSEFEPTWRIHTHKPQTKSHQVDVSVGFKACIILLVHGRKDVCHNAQRCGNSLKEKWKIFLVGFFPIPVFWILLLCCVEHARTTRKQTHKQDPKRNMAKKIRDVILVRFY